MSTRSILIAALLLSTLAAPLASADPILVVDVTGIEEMAACFATVQHHVVEDPVENAVAFLANPGPALDEDAQQAICAAYVVHPWAGRLAEGAWSTLRHRSGVDCVHVDADPQHSTSVQETYENAVVTTVCAYNHAITGVRDPLDGTCVYTRPDGGVCF